MVGDNLNDNDDYSTPSVSTTPFNLWRQYPVEPAVRGYIRGTVALIAFTILIAFSIYTIAHAADKSTLYALRTYTNQGVIPQPHLFTNHCTSAMALGGDQNAFESLIQAQSVCHNGSTGSPTENTAYCTPVWYSANKGFVRDAERFKSFYAEDDTDACLALECPPCSNLNTQGQKWVWINRAAHIGTTALWPWGRTPNPLNSADNSIPFNVYDTPFTVQNGSHLVAEVSYTENGQSGSSTFRDFIGIPNRLWLTGHYNPTLIIPARQPSQSSAYDASLIIQAPAWPNWESSNAYTTTTLPELIGSLGGLWTAFTGVIASIFGTSMAFILFGSKRFSISPPFPFGKRTASRNLDALYLSSGVPIDREAHLKALTVYLADFVVDTGELDLRLGRVPEGGGEFCDSTRS